MFNRKAYEHALDLIRQGKVDRTSEWSSTAEDGNKILGDPPDWDKYARWFLLTEKDADPKTKEAYKYPFGKEGKVYRSALTAIRQRAAQQKEDEVFEAAGRLLEAVDEKKEMAEGLEAWIPVFATGTHTDSKGRTRTWTEADLERIAEKYDPAHHEAPAVIGHPEDNAPAWGWVAALKREGEVLFAKLRDLVPEFVEMLRKKMFKKRSISLYPDLTLRHVGFLGASPPAVKGLKDVNFEDGKDTLEIQLTPEGAAFEEESQMTLEELKKQLEEAQRRIQELEGKEASFAEAQKQKDEELKTARAQQAALQAEIDLQRIRHRVDGLVNEGKLAPCFVEMGIVDFMAGLEAAPEIQFSDSEGKPTEKKTPAAWFEAFLDKLPQVVEFREIAKDGRQKDNPDEEDVKQGLKIAGKDNKK